ncbi:MULTISPECIES: ParB/RepB/Spo0J family partition protein [Asaia]|uniref:ParB/RepB/Spo0J family partition protein n=1 Tax=Asaia TaxID=91914 RepID=UPI002FC2E4CB
MTSIMKRKGPSRMMETMGARVQDLGHGFVQAGEIKNHSFEVDVNDVFPDPGQPRKVFKEEELKELSESLKTHGQLSPIIVRRDETKRGKWIIIAGERRWRAATRAGLTTLLAIENSGPEQVLSLIENLQREDLHPVEEAIGVAKVVASNRWSQREASRQLGKSASEVNGMIAVAKLPEAFLQSVLNSEHRITRNLLVELARLPATADREALMAKCLKGELTIPMLRTAVASGGLQDQDAERSSEEESRSPKGNTIRPKSYFARVNKNLSKIAALSLDHEDKKAAEVLYLALGKILGR